MTVVLVYVYVSFLHLLLITASLFVFGDELVVMNLVVSRPTVQSTHFRRLCYYTFITPPPS